jgi:hypothetical protein
LWLLYIQNWTGQIKFSALCLLLKEPKNEELMTASKGGVVLESGAMHSKLRCLVVLWRSYWFWAFQNGPAFKLLL